MRVQLESVERQTGKRDPLLDSVKVPDGFAYLFDMYWQIRSGQAVSYRDLADYMSVTGIVLDAFEISAIKAMDAAFEGFLADRLKKTTS